jgi:Carboxypeptidase regulatory-like domain/TonB dependent receptor
VTRRCIAVAVFVFSLTLPLTTLAQVDTTSLRGIVRDSSGAVVPGAQVTITNGATGHQLTTKANGAGEYSFVQIAPAMYTIAVDAKGFGSQTKSAELLVNQPATVDFTMTVQAVSEVVNVSAEAQTLNTTDASLGNSEDNALIQALPSETRNVPDLLSLQPGVLYLPNMGASESNPGGDSRSGAVNGVRSDQGNVTMDGIDDNDQVFGYAFTGVLRETQDSVEEFRVTTANSNSDEGRSAGAQVSLVTKSGTNKFHGSAYEYYRPPLTVSNDYFNKQAELAQGLPNIPPKFLRNIFGAAVGGPIVKDKLFFFGNYEGTRRAEDYEQVQTTPTASYKAGILTYQGDTTNGGITNVGLTPAQVTALDAGCQVCNGANGSGYTPGPGPNPNALAYFAAMPTANGTTEGDGLNEGSYTFASPNPLTLNTSIARLDYTPNAQHRIFVRGNLQKDTTGYPENFPGQGPSQVYEDNTKGVIGGDTWSLSPNLVNDVRYGYIRQGNSTRGVGVGDYVDFRFLSSPTAETRTLVQWVPVNNIVDNLNWNKGKHDFQFGGNWRLIHQNRVSDQNSYNGGSTNPYWLCCSPPSPTGIGADPVDGGFTNSYEIAYDNLVGTVPSVTDVYNYKITSATSGTLLPDGASIARHFKANEYEAYAQDAWHAMPNLVLTLGVRYSLLQTPWETSGQQVTPTIDTHAWFQERETAALQGQVYEPSLAFAPSGPFYNSPGFWPKAKNNFAPRLAIAYSPNSKTSIRAGAGIYYSHFGEGVVNAFDQHGAFGVSSAITNPADLYTVQNSPRYTARNVLPFNNGIGAPTQTFPYSPPTGPADGFAITWGLDSRMKTPYMESFNFSVQHQFPKGFTLETDYVGNMGRHLLQSLDLAEPVDFVDPGGGGDYYRAGTALSKLVDQDGGGCNCIYNSSGAVTGNTTTIAPIKYWEDMFPFWANTDYPGESATQAIFNDQWAPFRDGAGETTSLADLDFYETPSNYTPRFWQGQFSSLYALSTIGMSYYNAAQVTLRHPTSHGLEMDVSYTWSRSIDYGSDAERSTEFGTSGSGGSFSDIINTWRPYYNKGVSDFDTKQLLTVDGVYQLPFGKGRPFLSNANRIEDVFLGGWQLSGINRTTSGLPFSLFAPGWSTDWQIESYGVVTAPVKMQRHFEPGGNPQYFTNANAINSGVPTGSPVRLAYPGEAGERNNFRGDGYFDIDNGLAKTWSLSELGSLKFDWEVYNVTNTVRFDPASIGSGLTGGNLGVASSELTQGRRMQFALRYDF